MLCTVTEGRIKAIINAKLIIGHEIIEGRTVLFDRTIVAVENGVDLDNIEVIDADGAYLSPGFIDIHIHGSGGADVMDATPEALERLSVSLLQTGTTSFLATTMTMSRSRIDAALNNIALHGSRTGGAEILGVHLEGPFINPEKHGAQDTAYIQSPSIALIEPYMDIIKMITVAPEVQGAESFIRYIREVSPHVVLSIGHSSARYDEAKESFSWGISHATHLFNAMTPLHHREPGIPGAVFDSDVTCDVIADLIHLHPSVLAMVQKQKQGKLILITDAIRAGCMQCGRYDLGGQSVTVKEGKATLDDGTLAGSVLQINRALANMVIHTSWDIPHAVESVTLLPARKLGLNKGILQEGYDADMVLFDKDFSIISTIVAGKVKYQRR
jgi:N-acetylglucosamine-6-phosphate deacetylase